MVRSNPTQILIADGDRRMARSLKLLLASRAEQVGIATTAEEVAKALRTHRPDLLLMDVALAGMGIYDIIGQLQRHDPTIPILHMTGHGEGHRAVAPPRNTGIYELLKKPFEPDELLQKVNHALEQRLFARESSMISAQLKASERRYRFLVEYSPDIIYTLDRNGCFTFTNRALGNLLGYSRGTLIGRPYRTIIYQHDYRRAQWLFNERRTGQRAAQNAELRLAFNRRSVHREATGKAHLTIELSATGIYDKASNHQDKKFLGTYGVARDVTYRKQLDVRRHEVRKMEAIGTLAGGVAHDFNNLLMGIQGYTSLLLNHCRQCPDNQHTKLQRIEQIVQFGGELTRQLVGFARGGKYQVKLIRLNDIIEEATELFARTHDEIQFKLILNPDSESDYDPNFDLIRADVGQIKQVLLNIFMNAWQAMPDGGTIRVSSRPRELEETGSGEDECPAGNYVRVTVEDTGIGMSPETMKKVFEPFFTTKTRGRGTGLGMAAAYGIINNHGGTIQVDSELGRGSTFTIMLPRCLVE